MAAEARDRCTEAGFTIVEMLVSLALCALLALLMVQTIQATGLINRTVRRLDAQEETRLVREHLRRVFADRVGRRTNGRHAPFLGMPDHIAVMVQANRDAERATEARLEVGTLPSPGGLALIEISGPADAQGLPETLLDRIAGLHLRYFGAQDGDAGPRWAPTWTRRDRPPALVEVTVGFLPADPRRWPPLVLALGDGT